MTTKQKPEKNNTLTINGTTFRTQGNIVFTESDDTSYYLAEGSHLKEMEGMLEHGMQMLLNKVKT